MATGDGIFRRVAVASLIVGALLVAILTPCFSWAVGLSFALGVGIGLASLGTLNALVDALTREKARTPRARLFAVGALQTAKYGLIGAGLYLLLSFSAANPPALVAGFTVPTLVLCLSAAGLRARPHRNGEGG